ncbi:tail fiber assembly protein [Gilliamella sp. Nev3-1]|uniref:tail fiber assembly protein n=1 Tax=Gilliamella sp. Nev3-1 TaxID=3120250 RepID=UPI00080E76E5|nr:tail fiber assembly protein [Gilliamella apicola]OCG60814.1 hypothetical protein A9G40_03095 [Gilliamella apicola]
MKYYKDNSNQVYAYCADGSQDEFIPADQVAITEKEALKLVKPQLADIHYQNQSIKNSLFDEASKKISLLQDIIELDMQKSNEEEQLKRWKKYRILLNDIDVTQTKINWPKKPE